MDASWNRVRGPHPVAELTIKERQALLGSLNQPGALNRFVTEEDRRRDLDAALTDQNGSVLSDQNGNILYT